jgi:hypothetical protein
MGPGEGDFLPTFELRASRSRFAISRRKLGCSRWFSPRLSLHLGFFALLCLLALFGILPLFYKAQKAAHLSNLPSIFTTPAEIRNALTVPLQRDCGPWQKVYFSMLVWVSVLYLPSDTSTNSYHHYVQSYTSLHRKILAGEAPQRYVTWRCNPAYSTMHAEAAWCGGLRDRMRGIINSFLYAVLNDRAFLMDSKVRAAFFHIRRRAQLLPARRYQFPTPWEDLFDSPNGVQWQYTPEREAYIKTLNSSEVIFQVGDPKAPFERHEEIKDVQNIILVS